LNAGYVLFMLPLMHRRLLSGELRSWWIHDVGLPFAAALVVACIGRGVVGTSLPTPFLIAGLICTSVSSLLAALWATPLGREWIRQLTSGAGSSVEA
jgi:hypothetical protein